MDLSRRLVREVARDTEHTYVLRLWRIVVPGNELADSRATAAHLTDILAATKLGEPLSFYIALPHAPSRATLIRAIRAGQLPAVRTASGYRIEPIDFARWAGARRGVGNGSPRSLADAIAAETPEIGAERAARIAARIEAGCSSA